MRRPVTDGGGGGGGTANNSHPTDYIAPLMANFVRSPESEVTFTELKVQGGKSEFVVRWVEVTLEDQPELGAYTFQVTHTHTHTKRLFVIQDWLLLLHHENTLFKLKKSKVMFFAQIFFVPLESSKD